MFAVNPYLFIDIYSLHGKSTFLHSFVEVVSYCLTEASETRKLEQKMQKLAKVKVLIIDELGYCPFSANGSHLLFQLVSRRYESKSTVVTSNRPVSDWGLILGDSTAATAILDRLLHHCTVLTINGDSYRLLSAKKANLLAKN
jgi:DNA replication protein DnaC